MTLVQIFADGTVFPNLRANDLIIEIEKNTIRVGRFCADSYRLGLPFLAKPVNGEELKNKITEFINNEAPFLFEKKHPVFILCPKSLAIYAKWENEFVN